MDLQDPRDPQETLVQLDHVVPQDLPVAKENWATLEFPEKMVDTDVPDPQDNWDDRVKWDNRDHQLQRVLRETMAIPETQDLAEKRVNVALPDLLAKTEHLE